MHWDSSIVRRLPCGYYLQYPVNTTYDTRARIDDLITRCYGKLGSVKVSKLCHVICEWSLSNDQLRFKNITNLPTFSNHSQVFNEKKLFFSLRMLTLNFAFNNQQLLRINFKISPKLLIQLNHPPCTVLETGLNQSC